MTNQMIRPTPEPEIIPLKVCPFCGTPAYLWRYNYGTIIQCGAYDSKRHRVSVEARTTEKAIEEWNRRAVW